VSTSIIQKAKQSREVVTAPIKRTRDYMHRNKATRHGQKGAREVPRKKVCPGKASNSSQTQNSNSEDGQNENAEKNHPSRHATKTENNQIGNPCQNVVLESQKRGGPSQSRKVFQIVVSVTENNQIWNPCQNVVLGPRKGEDPPKAEKCSKSLFL
jgi:hypothetical protein